MKIATNCPADMCGRKTEPWHHRHKVKTRLSGFGGSDRVIRMTDHIRRWGGLNP